MLWIPKNSRNAVIKRLFGFLGLTLTLLVSCLPSQAQVVLTRHVPDVVNSQVTGWGSMSGGGKKNTTSISLVVTP
ncbi:MAG: hypothetical protein NTW94_10080 [Legionellales bacterium]|nr:hypothetical protein [Legionellales bacterium]